MVMVNKCNVDNMLMLLLMLILSLNDKVTPNIAYLESNQRLAMCYH